MFDELVRQKIELAPPKGRYDLRGSENPDLYTEFSVRWRRKITPNSNEESEKRKRKKKKDAHFGFPPHFPFNVHISPSSSSSSFSREISIRDSVSKKFISTHASTIKSRYSLSSFFPPPPPSLSLHRTETDLVEIDRDPIWEYLTRKLLVTNNNLSSCRFLSARACNAISALTR